MQEVEAYLGILGIREKLQNSGLEFSIASDNPRLPFPDMEKALTIKFAAKNPSYDEIESRILKTFPSLASVLKKRTYELFKELQEQTFAPCFALYNNRIPVSDFKNITWLAEGVRKGTITPYHIELLLCMNYTILSNQLKNSSLPVTSNRLIQTQPWLFSFTNWILTTDLDDISSVALLAKNNPNIISQLEYRKKAGLKETLELNKTAKLSAFSASLSQSDRGYMFYINNIVAIENSMAIKLIGAKQGITIDDMHTIPLPLKQIEYDDMNNILSPYWDKEIMTLQFGLVEQNKEPEFRLNKFSSFNEVFSLLNLLEKEDTMDLRKKITKIIVQGFLSSPKRLHALVSTPACTQYVLKTDNSSEKLYDILGVKTMNFTGGDLWRHNLNLVRNLRSQTLKFLPPQPIKLTSNLTSNPTDNISSSWLANPQF